MGDGSQACSRKRDTVLKPCAGPSRARYNSRVSDEHPLRHRALAVRGLLGDVWGNGMPDTPDPWLTMTTDGIACDDLVGREHGYVVLGDGLALETLAALLRAHPDPVAARAALPPALRNRLEVTG